MTNNCDNEFEELLSIFLFAAACLRESNGFCWNQQSCQIKCNCGGSSCTRSGKCCDPNCVGGCDENDVTKCNACSKFLVDDTSECRESCPKGYFEVRFYFAVNFNISLKRDNFFFPF